MKWILALGFTFAVVATSIAQERGAKQQAAGTTRVAVINLGLVFNQYEKSTEYKDAVAKTVKGMQDEAQKLTADINRWQTALQKKELNGETKEQVEEQLIDARRRMEDLNRLAQARVGKTQQKGIEKLWGDIHAAVKEYAAQHKIELVIAYGEQLKKEAVHAFPDIDRKLRTADTGGSMPFFVAPGVDISEAVTELLNRKYRAEKAKVPAGKTVDL